MLAEICINMIKFHRARNYYAKQNFTSMKYFSFVMYVSLCLLQTIAITQSQNSFSFYFGLAWMASSHQILLFTFLYPQNMLFSPKNVRDFIVRFCLGSFLTFHALISNYTARNYFFKFCVFLLFCGVFFLSLS